MSHTTLTRSIDDIVDRAAIEILLLGLGHESAQELAARLGDDLFPAVTLGLMRDEMRRAVEEVAAVERHLWLLD